MAFEQRVEISVETARAVEQVRRLERQTEALQREIGVASRSATTAATSFSTMARRAGGIATAVTGVVGSFAAMTKSALDTADATAKTADKIGLTTDSLQELRFSRRIGEADKGTGVLSKTFKQLNIDTRDSSGSLKSVDDLLDEYADKLAAAKDPQEQLRLAVQAFDTEGGKMVNMLRGGKKGLDALRKSARLAGAVIEENLLRSAERTNDQFEKFSTKIVANWQRGILQMVIASKLLLGVYDTIEDKQNAINESGSRIILLQEKLKKAQNGSSASSGGFLGVSASEITSQVSGGVSKEQSQIMISLEEELKIRDKLIKQRNSQREQEKKSAEDLKKLQQFSTFSNKPFGSGGSAGSSGSGETEREEQLKRASELTTQFQTDEEKLSLSVKELTESYNRQDISLETMTRGSIAASDAFLSTNEAFIERQRIMAEGAKTNEQFATSEDKLLERQIELKKQLDENVISPDIFKTAMEQAKKAFSDSETQILNWKEVGKTAITGIADGFIDMAFSGKTSFADFTRSFLIDISKMIVKQVIFNALKNSSVFGALFTSADGNVFNNGNPVSAFASGGIVSSPTVFPMANGGVGLMGEAGPEAIMPLKRKGGRLGVEVSGGGGQQVINQTFNIQGVGDKELEKKLQRAAQQGYEMSLNDVRRNGPLRRGL